MKPASPLDPLPILLAVLLASLAAIAHAEAREPLPPVPEAADQFRIHGLAAPPEKAEGRFRLATWNVHELYDEADDPTLTGREDDLRRVMPPSRRAAVVRAIDLLDADVLALQEVESLEALAWFRDSYLSHMGYEHAASIDVGHPIGMEQAVLSRFPILDSKVWTGMSIGVHPDLYRGRPSRYAGEPMHFRRSPLMVEFDLTGEGAGGGESGRLTLVVVHFKTGQGSEPWRRAEAEGVAKIVEELKADRPGRRVVVAGDFAGGVGEGYLKPLAGAGFHELFTDAEGPAGAIATGIDGSRTCLILIGPSSAPMAEGAPRFVLGTPAPPRGLDRDIAFQMPGFASDRYPVAVDLVRPGGE